MLGNSKRYTFFLQTKTIFSFEDGDDNENDNSNGPDNHCTDDYGGDRILSRNPTSRMPIK